MLMMYILYFAMEKHDEETSWCAVLLALAFMK